MSPYNPADLKLIAAEIGPCLEGRDRGEMLVCIERAAQDFITASQDYNAKRRATMCAQLEATGDPADLLKYIGSGGQDLPLKSRPTASQDRNTLLAAAAALRKAERRLAELGSTGSGHLAWEEVESGLKVRVDGMAAIVDAAAESLSVTSGPDPSAFDRFIVALARIVEHFSGWQARAPTHTRVFVAAPDDVENPELIEGDESRYAGPFLDVVKACAEPLGTKKKDEALSKAIGRALKRTG